jgi:ABC-type Fe3+-hydroxamate transport system substrate-binding protein
MIRSLNLFGVVLAVVLGIGGFAFYGRTVDKSTRSAFELGLPSDVVVQPLPDGTPAVLDRSGRLVPIGPYQRIASASTISDTLLLELVSPVRIVAFTQYSQTNSLFGHKYEDKPRIDALRNMEVLLELRPDLLVVSTLSAETRLERLREAGLNVFVLGEMRGMQSFLHNVRSLSVVLGRPDLGEMYARNFERRMRSIVLGLGPHVRRKTAMQLTFYGKKIYGSGRGTSYHDVIRHAGLIDLGAEHYEGWPVLGLEQLLALDPDLIITRDAMGASLCGQGALAELKACANDRGGIIELPDALINDPGPMMLPSAELIFRAAYGGEGAL